MVFLIKVGYIATTYGNKGELKVMSLANNPHEFKKFKYMYLNRKNIYEKIHIERLRFHKKFLIIKFKEILDMNMAEELREAYLYLPEDELTPLPEDHFYIFQLIGLDVFQGDEHLGKIKDIIETGSNDVFIVENGTKEILIPALKTVIKEINFDNKTVLVQLPLGLLD